VEKDKKAAEEKIGAVRKFLESRMLWTAYTRDISTRLPPSTVLNTFIGKNPLGGKMKEAAGSFQLEGTAPLSPDGSIPREIDVFLSALPKDPLWKRDFASVVTDIKLPPAGKKKLPEVNFTIVGQCRAKAAENGSQGGGEGKKGEK